MNRREFLALGAAITLVPALARANALGFDYTPEGFAKARASGLPVFLIYGTDWCSTCAAQARAITALKAENPAYAAGITFIYVDWDKWKNTPIATDLKIPRRSTLVALKGETEMRPHRRQPCQGRDQGADGQGVGVGVKIGAVRAQSRACPPFI